MWKFILLVFAVSVFLGGCGENHQSTEKIAGGNSSISDSLGKSKVNSSTKFPSLQTSRSRQRIKLGHTINTSANEYLPIFSSDGEILYFSAMDRTGFFDFKLDFTKEKSSGGEDIFVSNRKEGIWQDAKPLSVLNTNGHEVVSQVFKNGNLLVTGNYPEKLGVKNDKDAGKQTTDLFLVRTSLPHYQINHLPEPVNTIYSEADGLMGEKEDFIIFVSDRPGLIGDYHKKGWKWNESYWGNTDVFVSLKDGDYWSEPINLGAKVNTSFAERTPWLSSDGLMLFVSSNGYETGKSDLDVYAFTRTSVKSWTDWVGPFRVDDACTDYDDWGYKETSTGDAYLASSNKLKFKQTQGGAAGDGGFRETNFRPGYEIYGLQVASLDKQFGTDIYFLQSIKEPIFLANDVFFDFNSFSIKKTFEKYLVLLVDQLKENPGMTIVINGHTDDVGNIEYNNSLSKKRSEAIKDFLMQNGINNTIETNGWGPTNPVQPNDSPLNRQKNRRVEIFVNKII